MPHFQFMVLLFGTTVSIGLEAMLLSDFMLHVTSHHNTPQSHQIQMTYMYTYPIVCASAIEQY